MAADPPDLIELADLAAQAKRYFRWDIILLLAALGILVLDLQIKRTIARQGIAASEAYARAEAASSGRRTSSDVAAASDDSGQRGGGSGDAVDGSPAVAEGPDPVSRPKQARGRGVVQRPEGDAP